MMDKVQKIREEVVRLKSNLIHGACASQIAMETRCKEEAYDEVLAILDTMQEEPVSEELEEIAWNHADKKCHLDIAVFTPDEVKKERGKMQFTWQDLYDAVMFGAKWQKIKDESTTEDLGDYINELSKQFPEVSFAKLSRIAVRVSRWQRNQDVKNKLPKVISRTDLDEYAYQCAYDMSNDWAIDNPTWHDVEDACKLGAKWQEKQDQSTIELAEDHAMLAGMNKMEEQIMKNLWKPADGDDLPIIDREVIVLTQPYPLVNSEYTVSFAHRPNPDGWDGKSVTTGKVEHYTPKTYGKGGWNIPDVKFWLDCLLPNMED